MSRGRRLPAAARTQEMYQYSAYNLGIGSEIELPALPVGQSNGDLSIRWDSSVSVSADPAVPIRIRIGKDESALSFHRMGHFRVRNGNEVGVSPVFENGLDAIRLFLSGVVMGTVLYQRGWLVLHASCVNMMGRAVAFTGPVGAGKSSLAAALYSHGHAIVADDNTAVVWRQNAPRAIPAFPQLKVASDTAGTLGYDDSDLRLLHPLESKRGLRANAGFQGREVPMAGIYVLGVGPKAAITRVGRMEALAHLLALSMPTRLSQPESPEQFSACARAALEIPVFAVKRTQALEDITGLVHMVEDHAASLH